MNPTPDWLPEPTTPAEHAFSKMVTDYGLQCAEAAVERERARCKEIVDSMVQVVKETQRPESLQSYRDYTAQLLEFLSEKLSGK